MKISKQKSHVSKWGYYNWTNTSLVAGENFTKPKFHASLYLGKTWFHIML